MISSSSILIKFKWTHFFIEHIFPFYSQTNAAILGFVSTYGLRQVLYPLLGFQNKWLVQLHLTDRPPLNFTLNIHHTLQALVLSQLSAALFAHVVWWRKLLLTVNVGVVWKLPVVYFVLLLVLIFGIWNHRQHAFVAFDVRFGNC